LFRWIQGWKLGIPAGSRGWLLGRPLQQSSMWKLASRLVAVALCNFLWTQGSFCNEQVFILLNMESGYQIVTVRVI
jgi:hypothetical protein